VRKGKIEPEKLLVTDDITEQCDALVPEIEHKLADMLEAIRKKDEPQVAIGPHCGSPYSCPLECIC